MTQVADSGALRDTDSEALRESDSASMRDNDSAGMRDADSVALRDTGSKFTDSPSAPTVIPPHHETVVTNGTPVDANTDRIPEPEEQMIQVLFVILTRNRFEGQIPVRSAMHHLQISAKQTQIL